jgi:hypothetical protein
MQWMVYGTDATTGANARIVIQAASAHEAEQEARGRNLEMIQVQPIAPQSVLAYGAAGSPFARVVAQAKWVRAWSLVSGIVGWLFGSGAVASFVWASTNMVWRVPGLAIGLACVAGALAFLIAQAGLNLLSSLAAMAQDVARGGVIAVEPRKLPSQPDRAGL